MTPSRVDNFETTHSLFDSARRPQLHSPHAERLMGKILFIGGSQRILAMTTTGSLRSMSSSQRIGAICQEYF